MPWVDVLRAVFRRWWVLLAVFALCAATSFSIRSIGSEFIAQSTLTVVGPRTENPLLDSARPVYLATVIIAVFEHYDDSYADELRAEGLSDDFTINFFQAFPAITIVVKAPSHAGVRVSAERISNDFIARVDSVQAERDIPAVTRLGAGLLEVTQLPPRPAGSKRALAGMMVASAMIAGACAYGTDQFLLPWLVDSRARRASKRRLARLGAL